MTGHNKDYPWEEYDHGKYNDRNYAILGDTDMLLANAVIDRLDQLNVRGLYSTAFEIGACATLRTAGIVAPLLGKDAVYTFSDVAPRLVTATKLEVHQASIGNLGKWQPHQDAMAEHNPAWTDCIQQVCKRAAFAQKDVFADPNTDLGLKPESTEIAVAGHAIESATPDIEVYRRGFAAWAGSIATGTATKPGIGIMFYMVGSNGYRDSYDGRTYPAVPIYEKDIYENADKNELEVIMHKWIPKNPEDHVRAPGDPTTYAGLGAAVMLKRL
jgi:hypothetical protein